MYDSLESFEESEFRMSDSELISFYKKFTRNELNILNNILHWVPDTDVKNELNILQKVLEHENLKEGRDYLSINLSKKRTVLTDKELKTLYIVADEAHMFINFAYEIKTTDDDPAEIYMRITEKIAQDVAEEIENRMPVVEKTANKTKKKIK